MAYELSEAGEIVARLVARGENYQSIGERVGARNRSLIRQMVQPNERGYFKPGNNLRDALSELERRLASGEAPPRRASVAEPPRRQTAAGRLARVRKPTTVRGRSWTASTVKRSAVRSGARGLGHPLSDAARSGRQVAATVSVDRSITVESYGSSRRGRAGVGGSADFKLGDGDEVWETVQRDYDGDVTAYVADAMLADGLVSGVSAVFLAEHIVEIDIRTFD